MNLIGRCCRVAVLSILALACFHAVSGQSLREHKQRIDAAVERRNEPAAITELKSLRKAEPSAFTLNNYDYLLARLSQRRGDRATAATGYRAVVSRRSVLSQYAHWHLAEIARATGNLLLEREQLRGLMTSAPSSLLRTSAVIRLGQSFLESGDYPAAIAALRQISGPKTSPTARAALVLIGQAYLRSGQDQPARDAFDSLISEAPDSSRPDDYALQAARGLDELDGRSAAGNNSTQQKLAESEHSRRAQIYQFNREFAAARTHYQALVADYPQSSALPDALYQIGRGLFQEAKYDDAITYLQQLQAKFPANASARDALGLMASSQNRLKRTDDAVASYVHFIYRYPEAPNPERPYLNLIDVLREAGRDNEALKWVQQTRTRFKGQTAATLALFSQARIRFAQAAWSTALDDLDALQKERDLGGVLTAGSTNAGEVSFMRAYTLEQLGRTEEAVNAYLAIADGRSEYYGGQSTLRLRALGRQPDKQNVIGSKLAALRAEARQGSERGDADRARVSAQAALRLTDDAGITRDLLEIARGAYASLPAYSPFPPMRLVAFGRQEALTSPATERAGESADNAEPSHQELADELLFLGLHDEGAPELAASQSEKASGASSTDFAYTLAVCFMRGGNANQALRFALPLWKNVPRDYLLELAPRQMTELLYPAPHTPALLMHGPKRGVDPRFLLAIARQESAFLPEAKSASAARGLMQFISATAGDIASQLGKRSFRDEELYDPSVSILFGAQYVSNLFKRFPGNPQAVAASYNGGDENVARWIARSHSNEADRYVLEIGFAQTKDYVYRVMSNYRAYQTLYSEKLEAH